MLEVFDLFDVQLMHGQEEAMARERERHDERRWSRARVLIRGRWIHDSYRALGWVVLDIELCGLVKQNELGLRAEDSRSLG